MVDTWVVGNFVSNEAFSAVGTVGPIINMLIGFFMGLSSGAGVVISQYCRAHKPDKGRGHRPTAMVLTLVLCGVFTAPGPDPDPGHAGPDEHPGGGAAGIHGVSVHLFFRHYGPAHL